MSEFMGMPIVCVEGLPPDELRFVEQFPPKTDMFTGKVTVEYQVLGKIINIGKKKEGEKQ